jgi:lipoprotein-anchoring transpeptidase ErfK/SrfK
MMFLIRFFKIKRPFGSGLLLVVLLIAQVAVVPCAAQTEPQPKPNPLVTDLKPFSGTPEPSPASPSNELSADNGNESVRETTKENGTVPENIVSPSAPVVRRIDEAKPMKPAPHLTEPGAARAGIVTERELAAQLQIFLDQQLFSPGRIDGKGGVFTQRALMRWQKANGFPQTGVVDENVPYKEIFPVYTEHVLQKGDLKMVGILPSKTSEQAKRSRLPYASTLEFLSERYHCSPEFLQKLNPGIKFAGLKAGDAVRVPNVAPFKVEEVLSSGNLTVIPEFKTRRIVVNRKETFLEVYDGEKMICAVPIAPGSPKHPTPQGKFRILGVATMPTFRWDAGVLNYGKRTDNFYLLPPGPNNPVGVVWIGLSKPGIGIHGTNNPASIGTWASHGCMRTANWDAIRLASLVTAGCSVEIQ